jgi:entericidin B
LDRSPRCSLVGAVSGAEILESIMKIAFAAFTLFLATAAAACNTVEGAGKDVEAVGNSVQDAADDAKN